jgi:hypothetical protein
MVLISAVVAASLSHQRCTRPQEVTEQDAIIAVGLVDSTSLTDSESILACSSRMMLDFSPDPDAAYLEVHKCASVRVCVCVSVDLRLPPSRLFRAPLRPKPWAVS